VCLPIPPYSQNGEENPLQHFLHTLIVYQNFTTLSIHINQFTTKFSKFCSCKTLYTSPIRFATNRKVLIDKMLCHILLKLSEICQFFSGDLHYMCGLGPLYSTTERRQNSRSCATFLSGRNSNHRRH